MNLPLRDFRLWRPALSLGCVLLLAGCSSGRTANLLGKYASRACLNLAIKFENLKQYQPSLGLLNLSLHLQPENALTHYVRGIVYYDLDKYAEAAGSFSQALASAARQPQDEQILERLAGESEYLYQLRGRAYAKLGEYEKALADFNTALKLNPEFIPAFLARGEEYYRRQQYPQARADFTAAIHIEPSENTYQSRGLVYAAEGNYPAAIADDTRALEMQPSGNGYYNRGVAYANNGQDEKAIADFTRAVELDAGLADAWYSLGVVCERNRRLPSALAAYRKFLRFTQTGKNTAKEAEKAAKAERFLSAQKHR